MASYYSLLLFVFTALISFTTAIPEPISPPSSFLQQQQLINNVINTLAGNGDFTTWAKILSAPMINASSLPFNTTIFVPSDDSLSHLPTTPPMSFDPLIVPYHIIPQRLFFSDLLRYNINARIPTLLPSNSILVTSNSVSNFTIDGSRITHPDLYVIEGAVVHGISRILDYAFYGSLVPGSLSPPERSSPPEAFSPEMTKMEFGKSEVSCLNIKLLSHLIPFFWSVLLMF